jgi:hypothetical protein
MTIGLKLKDVLDTRDLKFEQLKLMEMDTLPRVRFNFIDCGFKSSLYMIMS